MSFLAVLGNIGKTIGHGLMSAGPAALGAFNPALGTAAQAIISVVKAEIDHGAGTGPVKKAQATAEVAAAPAVLASVASPESKLQLISELLDAIVSVLNVLAKLFPGAPAKPAA